VDATVVPAAVAMVVVLPDWPDVVVVVVVNVLSGDDVVVDEPEPPTVVDDVEVAVEAADVVLVVGMVVEVVEVVEVVLGGATEVVVTGTVEAGATIWVVLPPCERVTDPLEYTWMVT
jgi:hypothetical protein